MIKAKAARVTRTRRPKVPEEEWRLKAGYTHHLPDGKILEGGDVIKMPAFRMDAFLDRFVRVSPPPEEPEKDETARLRLRSAGGGWYDVVNTATGEAVNRKKLRKAAAERMAGLADDPELM